MSQLGRRKFLLYASTGVFASLLLNAGNNKNQQANANSGYIKTSSTDENISQNIADESSLWWKNSVIYQIYPRTFADGNGDGSGDLQGIIQKLDYLNDGDINSKTSLHVDAIWLSPINKSPMYDNGYDISDYYEIDPIFGISEEFDTLIAEAHNRGIKVIWDLVINHTSDRHPWFVESSSSKDNPKRDWYHWKDPASGNKPPNNWLSYFNKPAWTYSEATEQYYYHAFADRQPDLNWSNPEVRQAVYECDSFPIN